VRTPGARVTEILTESFCERCGTRYTFESNARRRGFQRVRLLSIGVKHFVENDGSSVTEAMEAARGDLARAASSEQIDAFHRTFSFCMGCRQYTCTNCWNAAEGMCLTCAPDLSREVLPAPFPDLPLHPVSAAAAATAEATPAPEAWPAAEVPASAGAIPAAEVVGATEGAEAADALPAADEVPATEMATAVAEAAAEMALGRADTSMEGLAAVEGEEPPRAAEETAEEAATTEETVGEPALGVDGPPWRAVAAEAEATPAADFDAEPDAVAASGGGVAAAVEAEPEPKSVATTAVPAPVADQPAEHPDALTPDELALVAGALAARSAAARSPDAGRPDERVAATDEPRDHAAVGRFQTRSLLGQFRPARPSRPPATEPVSPPLPASRTPAASPVPAADIAGRPGATPVVPAPATPAAAASLAAGAAAMSPLGAEPAPASGRRDDLIEQPTWSVVAPDVAPSKPNEPAAPGRVPPSTAAGSRAPGTRVPPAGLQPPRTPRPAPGVMSPWAARLASARPETGVWAESSRDVLGEPGAAAPAGIQACVSCGLPLSATARFCRRCGARQG
jgi:hypothetical protein